MPNADPEISPYLRDLNPGQLEAVEALDGPVLVLAGAGTGKTRTLTARIAHILCTGRAWPSQILAVTFTNKAAAEMRERVERTVPMQIGSFPWLGTFHAISARILREHSERAGRKPNFTILDSDDQTRLLKQVITASGIDEKKWPARQLSATIDRWKNQCWLPSDVPASQRRSFEGRVVDLYQEYQQRLEILNSVDFGDLILLVVELLRQDEELLAGYQRRFKYILVDEYQDINTAQYAWLRLFAQGRSNICCVGDEDQSIYGWRGADVGNILAFDRHFDGVTVVRLEQNYRSTRHILAVAGAVIGNNRNRLGKELWTDLPGGEKVQLIGHWDGKAEASWIGSEIEALVSAVGSRRRYKFSDMAVLVRASFLMREIEDRFLALGLPYVVIGGARFYERKEIRDALAYFRLVVSSADDLAFERIVNTPRRAVGEKAQLTIRNLARQEGVSLLAAAGRLLADGAFTGRTAIGLNGFIGDIECWSELLRRGEMGHLDLAEQIIDGSGLPQMWLRMKTPEGDGRVENLKELVRSLREFDSIQGFLEHVSLVFDNLQEAEGDRVSIMTLHAAKGLEYPVIFLPAWEEGIFPSARTLEQEGPAGLEEERRLAYVGITRAREICTISCAGNRNQYGSWNAQLHSRFIDELPREELEMLAPPGIMASPFGNGAKSAGKPGSRFDGSASKPAGGYGAPGFRRLVSRAAERSAGAARREVEPAKAAAHVEYASGVRVFHQKFGYGQVRSQEGDKLVVEFECSGTKHIIASYVSLADGSEG